MGDTAAVIVLPKNIKTNNEKINKELDLLVKSKSVIEQQKCIKGLMECSDSLEDRNNVTKLLCYLFLRIDLKHPLKKTITRVLLSMKEVVVTLKMTVEIVSLLSECENCEKHPLLSKENRVLLSLSSCFNNFPPGLEALSSLNDLVLLFACNVFMIAVQQLYFENVGDKQTLRNCVYNSTKFLVSLLNNCDISDNFSKLTLKFFQACYIVITDESIPFNTRANCGSLLVIAAVHSPDNDEKGEGGLESLLRFKNGEIGITLGKIFLNKTSSVKVCILAGLLNTVPHEIICSGRLDGKLAPIFMFDTLVESAMKQTGKPLDIVEISRTFISLSRLLFNMDINDINIIFKSGLDYIWTHLDHFIDAVRHDTISVLKNFVKVAVMHEKNGNNKLMNQLINHLKDLLDNQSTNFKALIVIGNEISCEYLIKIYPELPVILLNNMKTASIAQQVSSCYEQLMEQYSKQCPDKWIDMWVKHLVLLIHESEPTTHSNYQKLFISAFKIDQTVIHLLTSINETYNTNELSTLLGCLISARKSNTKITFLADNEDLKEFWNGIIRYKLLKMFMCHKIAEIRILTLTLIIESHKTTEIFSEWDLKFLRKFLRYNITAQLPHIRQQMMALYKKAMMRYKESLYVIERKIKNLQTVVDVVKNKERELSELIRQQEYYTNFITSIFQIELVKGLLSDVNHPRRSNTLEMLLYIKNSISEEKFAKLWEKEYVVMLYKALDDSYESNIIMAAKLIMELPWKISYYQSKNELKFQFENAFLFASSIKSTSTVTAAYRLEVYKNSPIAASVLKEILGVKSENTSATLLLFQYIMNSLEEGVSIAKDNILMAARHSPIYGWLFCLRHLIQKEHFEQKESSVIPKIIDICSLISEVASPIVNASSPEGFMPGDLKNVSENTVTSQMILVYAWRAVKEISLLLGEISLTDSKGEEIIDKQNLLKISGYLTTLFVETKHRGAYEQAYLGFSKYCSKLWNSSNPVYSEWPEIWLKIILGVIEGKKDNINKICSTRRSAGIPFMIQSIITTEPQARNNACFHTCMESLLKIAEDFSNDNEKGATHSMNILRALYKHNQMGELVTPYVGRGVKIAIIRFCHPVWGVRNAATLMFSALMMRMFGVQRTRDNEDISIKNRLSAKVFFMRYPELFDFMLEKLKEFTNSDTENVSLFPLLLILARLFPSGDKSEMMRYLPYIEKCLSNSMFMLRELAAQASISAIPIDEYSTHITNILNLIGTKTAENLLHGKLLQLKLLFKNYGGAIDGNLFKLFEPSFWIIEKSNSDCSPLSGILYMEILIIFINKFKTQSCNLKELKNLMDIIELTFENIGSNKLSKSGTNFELMKVTLYLHLVLNAEDISAFQRENCFKDFLLISLHSSNEALQIYALNCLYYMLKTTPQLYTTSICSYEEDERFELEYELIETLKDDFKIIVVNAINIRLGCNNLFSDLFNVIRTRRKDFVMKVCLILPYLPGTVNSIRPKNLPVVLSKQLILDFLVCESARADSDIFSVILPVTATLLKGCKEKLNYDNLIKNVLSARCGPENSFDERLAVANFLVQFPDFLWNAEVLSESNMVEIWYIVLTLLQDNDLDVRDCLSEITCLIICPFTNRVLSEMCVTSEKSLMQLLKWMPQLIPFEEALKIFLSISLKPKVYHKSSPSDSIEVFDRGELNVYEEGDPLAIYTTQFLNEYLWELEADLAYKDKSIFIEEHTLLATIKLLDLLYNSHTSRIRSEDKLLCILVLQEMIKYLEVIPINSPKFKSDFMITLEKKFKVIFTQKAYFKDSRVELFLKRFFCFKNM